MTYSKETVLNALKSVIAPHMTMDIVAAGLVEDINVSDGRLSLSIKIKTPPKPVQEPLRENIQRAIREVLPDLESAQVDLQVDIPGQDHGSTALLPAVRNTIAVASGKGGVGKSTVAVNIAVSLAQAGARVGLIDADIYGPSIPMMLGVYEQPRAYRDGERTRILPIEKFGVQVMSIGFLIDADQAVVWRGPMASGALKQFLTDVDWPELDYLLFDMPPGTGDIQLTLSQALPLTGSVIVTTPQDISLADARKGVRMFEKVSVPILGIIENMSFHICSTCGHRDEIFSSGGGKAAADELRVPYLGELPLLTRVREAGDKGIPIVELEPASEVAASFMEVSMNLTGKIAERYIRATPAPKINISL